MKSAESPYHFLAHEILRLVPCERIAFAIPVPGASGFRLAGAHPDPSAFPEPEIPAADSCAARVLATRKGELLSAIGGESHYAEEAILYRAGIRDAAFVPLFVGGEAMGVVIVGRTEVNSLEPKSVRCLERVAGLLAAVLATARDGASAPRQTGDALPLATRYLREESAETVCRSLLEAAVEQTGIRRAVLTLLDPELVPFQWFFTGYSEQEIDAFHRDHLESGEIRALFTVGEPEAGPSGTSPHHLPLIGFYERPLGFLTCDALDGEPDRRSAVCSALRLLVALAALALERAQIHLELRRERSRLAKTQDQLVHAERLSAVGQLVSGVAHELNNPLAGVIGFAELALKKNRDPGCEKDLTRIVAEAQRCQHIVQNLLNFARRSKAERKALDVNEAVDTVLDLRAYQMRLDNVRIRTSLARNLPRTAADTHQIQQVLLNIITNAHQAMQEVAGERVLTVRTHREGERILIRIEDTGPGISPTKLNRVFEPFFTTKPAGKGTGLGLSLSQGIIRDHGGQIRVESIVGRGTTFTVDLPVVEVPEEAAPRVPSPDPAPAAAPHNILVVDDEPVIVDLLHEVLAAAGHSVETAKNGEQALDRIRSGGYDAVITDLKMPGMDGMGLYETVCRERPEMAGRFIFSTGDLASTTTQEFFRQTGCPCLLKPFDLSAVRTTLDRIFSRS